MLNQFKKLFLYLIDVNKFKLSCSFCVKRLCLINKIKNMYNFIAMPIRTSKILSKNKYTHILFTLGLKDQEITRFSKQSARLSDFYAKHGWYTSFTRSRSCRTSPSHLTPIIDTILGTPLKCSPHTVSKGSSRFASPAYAR